MPIVILPMKAIALLQSSWDILVQKNRYKQQSPLAIILPKGIGNLSIKVTYSGISINSTSKINVAPGGIDAPAPLSPYANSEGI